MITRDTLKEFLIASFQNNYKQCYIKTKFKYPEYFEKIYEFTSYLPETSSFKERLYNILNYIKEKPRCSICNNYAVFKDLVNGYSSYCNKCYRKDPLFREKIKKSNLETYTNKKEEIINKIKKTNLERYGIEEPNKLEEIKEKIKKTNLEKYGCEYTQQNEEVRKKTEETNLRRRGTKYSFQSDEVKKKLKKTSLKKYGVEYPVQSPIIKEKIKKSLKEKYGVDNISKVRLVMDHIQKVNRAAFMERFSSILSKLNFELVDPVYENNITNHKWKCLKCNQIFIENWRNMCRGFRCPICFPREKTSKAEQEIKEFLLSLDLDIQTNVRNIIYPKEIDIFIPSKTIAIEYNGLFWHSENCYCGKNYHLLKTEACNQKNIQLIHIFEDEWLFKKEIVKNRLKQILNKSDAQKIYARKCVIKEISSKLKNSFLKKYHIQGKDNATINLGGFYNNKLVAVMTFSFGNIAKGTKPKPFIWELNRFCLNYDYQVVGIAGKLLKYFERNYKWNEIFSYADRRWSIGNLYYKLGFKLEYATKPNYWYVKNYKRVHRFNLRKTKNDPKHITEKDLRLSQGYLRIWDCGSLKFSKQNLSRRN